MGEGPFVAVIPQKDVDYLALAFRNFMVTVPIYSQMKVTDRGEELHLSQFSRYEATEIVRMLYWNRKVTHRFWG